MDKPAKRIKKMLVPIDFSLYSRPVLEYAVEIAGITKARVVIVNIVNQRDIDVAEKITNAKQPDSFSLARYLSDEVGRRELKLKVLIRSIPGLSELPVKTVFGHGIPYAEILKAVDREKVDFMVFGPKGRDNLKGFLFGTVAEKLFRRSPVPVMSLRSRLE